MHRESTQKNLDFENVSRVERTIEDFGLLPMPQQIIERQAVLGLPNACGESFLGHSETLAYMTKELLDGLEEWEDVQNIQTEVRRQILTAANFHDIGKTGPAISINPNPDAFVKFYNVNFSQDVRKISLKQALEEAVKTRGITNRESNYIIITIRNYGLNPDTMTLRDFYNLHSLFTYEILKEANVDEKTATIASAHHLKRGVKPAGYTFEELAETGRFIEPLDELAAMTRINNPKQPASPIEKLLSVYRSFFAMSDSPIKTPYCRTMEVSMISGVLQKILTNHVRQIP